MAQKKQTCKTKSNAAKNACAKTGKNMLVEENLAQRKNKI